MMKWHITNNYPVLGLDVHRQLKAVLISIYLVAEIHIVTTNSYMVAERCDLEFTRNAREPL
jgi:hypothetical protein